MHEKPVFLKIYIFSYKIFFYHESINTGSNCYICNVRAFYAKFSLSERICDVRPIYSSHKIAGLSSRVKCQCWKYTQVCGRHLVTTRTISVQRYRFMHLPKNRKLKISEITTRPSYVHQIETKFKKTIRKE